MPNRFSRLAASGAMLPLALLLCACPKEQHDATVAFADGRAVFDGDRGECLSRLTVLAEDPGGGQTAVWQAVSPLPLGSDLPCPMRFPVTYGAAPDRVTTYPQDAPPLDPGRIYRLAAVS